MVPPSCLINLMEASRLLDVTEVNGKANRSARNIKISLHIFFNILIKLMLHQHRQAYDLFETKHGDLHTSPEGMFQN